jgi:hypothetical protein
MIPIKEDFEAYFPTRAGYCCIVGLLPGGISAYTPSPHFAQASWKLSQVLLDGMDCAFLY